MLLHKWIRLEKKDALEILDKIGEREDSVMFSREQTDVNFRTLPFYTNFRIYKLANYATMPVFAMYYLGNGDEFIPMNGLANPIYEANSKDPIHLTEKNVIQYLKFFFRYVQGSEGEVFLITEGRSLPHIEYLPQDKQQEIMRVCKPFEVSVETTDEQMLLKVKAYILYGDSVIKTNITVTVHGNIAFNEQEIVASGIYLPESVYNIYDDAA